jgi:hypothetical protein
MKITRAHLRKLIMEELAGQGRPWGGVRETRQKSSMFEGSDSDPSNIDVTDMFSDQYGADQVGIAYVAVMQDMRDGGESEDPITPNEMFERLKSKLEELYPVDTEEDDDFSSDEEIPEEDSEF